MMTHPIDEFIGIRIRDERKLAGISQQVLAKQIGLSFQQVQKYEVGTNRVSGSVLWLVAQSLNVPVSCFFPPEDVEEKGTYFSRPDLDQQCLLKNLSQVSEREQQAIMGLLEALAQRNKEKAHDLVSQ